jgi:methylglutaconyl-CoA hydratase
LYIQVPIKRNGKMVVDYSLHDRAAVITLNRPEKRNALNPQVVQELTQAFAKAAHDEQVRVVILKAAGEAFCAGADLAYLQQLQKFSVDENRKDSFALRDLYEAIYRHPKVVIAQVQGAALAGGCGLVSVCDFVFAVPEATFGYTEVRIGFIPAMVMVFLVLKLGGARARELALSGAIISAADAQRIGLIYRVVDKAQLDFEVLAFAQQLSRDTSGNSLKLTKKMLAEIPGMNLNEALHYAAEMNVQARSSADCVRGITAFLNKQKLTW